METSNLVAEPEEVYNLRGDAAKIEFINRFKEVQRLRTQLEQYTDLSEAQKEKIETVLPEEQLRSFRSSYLETAKQLKDIQQKEGDANSPVNQLDFEFVLFASAVVDYDYIMGLIAKYTQNKPSKQKMSRAQLISLLSSDAKLIDEREDMVAYINSLEAGKALNEKEIKEGYQDFKAEKQAKELADIARKARTGYSRIERICRKHCKPDDF
jgi:type I restriction enzyme R subunit